MSRLRRSENRWTFHLSKKRKVLEIDPSDFEAKEMVEYYENYIRIARAKEESDEWKEDNLEYDLRTSDYIAEKCRDQKYAQNLYAALCNNDFIKLDVWNILKDKRWSCSWRYSGGIVSDIIGEGDYLDWYCTGSKDVDGFVGEGIVTDEIDQDLQKLGWKVISDDSES